ncbi:hypothetical protein N7510_005311 [Penicillium lagena]|uniref:uncharacterized protein n=1 Tax=Penicillium lagena TaxID=94218 RepID=UPI00253F81C5|nr:uncharacterized protein N7510_005311 [Penicillium lagena]KAJ5612117.1 hypothetical protein N7510_005311 [Penicillium lagena]
MVLKCGVPWDATSSSDRCPDAVVSARSRQESSRRDTLPATVMGSPERGPRSLGGPTDACPLAVLNCLTQLKFLWKALKAYRVPGRVLALVAMLSKGILRWARIDTHELANPGPGYLLSGVARVNTDTDRGDGLGCYPFRVTRTTVSMCFAYFTQMSPVLQYQLSAESLCRDSLGATDDPPGIDERGRIQPADQPVS